jgi:hypothetical protein
MKSNVCATQSLFDFPTTRVHLDGLSPNLRCGLGVTPSGKAWVVGNSETMLGECIHGGGTKNAHKGYGQICLTTSFPTAPLPILAKKAAGQMNRSPAWARRRARFRPQFLAPSPGGHCVHPVGI